MSTRRPGSTSSLPGEGVDWAARRSDARRNHEQVLAAAREVFAERGAAGTIPEIAARAGVGKATVYRSYPTKDALFEAVAAEHTDWFERRVQEALSHPDAFTALQELMSDIAARIAENLLFLHILAGNAKYPGSQRTNLQQLIERGREQGTLRADATYFDIQILMGGCGRSLLDHGVTDPAMWRRYATLTLAALRAQPD